MLWKRIGHILDPRSQPGLRSHVQVPTPLILEDCIRIWFADRDHEGRSFPLSADLSRQDPNHVLSLETTPALPRGQPGTFDDDGIMPGHVLKHEGRFLFYYSGWNQRVRVPYHNTTGLAFSDDGRRFQRLYEGPVMDRTPTEPYIAVTPSLIWEEGQWKAWYVSGIRWELVEGKYEPVYVIKYASSPDGVYWNRPSNICIPQRHPQEAFSHPTVIHLEDCYHMWYCYRGSLDFRGGQDSYRLGYAWSVDGLCWNRQDDAVHLPPPEDWEAQMRCYPFVVVDGARLLMFYNGNGFGRTGIGIAEASVSELIQEAAERRLAPVL